MSILRFFPGLLLLAFTGTSAWSVEMESEPKLLAGEAPKVEVILRPGVGETIADVTAKSGDLNIPLELNPFRENVDAKVSVAFLIDVSAPAPRASQIKGAIAAVKSLLLAHPENFYEYGIYALGKEQLFEIAPAGTGSGRAVQMLDAYKPEGQTTQGYKLTQKAIEKLADRKAQRKVVVVLSDGKFEDKAFNHEGTVELARKSGVWICGIGFAANQDQSSYLQVLERLASDTQGIYEQAAYGTWALPADFADRFFGYLEGGVTVILDVAALEKNKSHRIDLEIKDGGGAFRKIDFEIHTKAADAAKGKEEKKDEEGKEKEKGKEKREGAKGKDGTEKKPDEAGGTVVGDTDTRGTEVPAAESPLMWYVIGGVVALVLLIGLLAVLIPKKKTVAPGGAETGAFIPPIAFLEMLDAHSTRHPIRISNVRIGRGRDNDLVLQNDSISSNHCVLKQSRDGIWTIVDLKSGNGVFVNDQRVEEAVLREGDLIELGEVKMRFYEAV